LDLIAASILSLGLTLSTASAQTSSSEEGKRKVKVKTSPAYPEIARHMNVTGKVRSKSLSPRMAKSQLPAVVAPPASVAGPAQDAVKRMEVFPWPGRDRTDR